MKGNEKGEWGKDMWGLNFWGKCVFEYVHNFGIT